MSAPQADLFRRSYTDHEIEQFKHAEGRRESGYLRHAAVTAALHPHRPRDRVVASITRVIVRAHPTKPMRPFQTMAEVAQSDGCHRWIDADLLLDLNDRPLRVAAHRASV